VFTPPDKPALSLVPRRTTHLPYIQKRGIGPNLQSISGYPKIEPLGHYFRSLESSDRVPIQKLRALANTIPARRAKNRIANGVLAMPWSINPPREDREKDSAIERAAQLERALRRPNHEQHNTYRKLINAAIDEILVLGFAAVERQPGYDSDRPFWLWLADGSQIRVNTEWQAHREELVPRFFDCGHRRSEEDWTAIANENLFIIQTDINTHELVPPSTLEVAYKMISSWLRLGEFQEVTTSQATREYLLSLIGASQEEIDNFRAYWQDEIQGKGKIPIVNYHLEVNKLGAKTDEELYLKYTDYLLKMIALAFNLTNRDFNITEHDNRATSGAAADSAFSDAILPMALTIQESLQVEVIDFYEPGFTLDYSDTEPRNQWDEASVASLLFKNNILTKDETRSRVGMPPIRGTAGNAFANGYSPDDDPEIVQQSPESSDDEIQENLGNNDKRETGTSSKPSKTEPATAAKTFISLTEPTQLSLF
jgi:hypothetical protein